MPEHGFEITPTFVETAEGPQLADFEVQDRGYHSEVIENFNENQDSWIVTDRFGNQHHKFALSEEAALTLDPDYVEPLRSEDFEAEMSQEEVNDIIDSFGGQEHYGEMLEWAASNLTPQAIDRYDSLMESGDRDTIQTAMRSLFELYAENSEYTNDEDYQAEEDDDDRDDPREAQLEGIIYSLVNPQEYTQLLQWAKNNLSEHQITQYDQIMANGSSNDVASAVYQLKKYYLDNQ